MLSKPSSSQRPVLPSSITHTLMSSQNAARITEGPQYSAIFSLSWTQEIGLHHLEKFCCKTSRFSTGQQGAVAEVLSNRTASSNDVYSRLTGWANYFERIDNAPSLNLLPNTRFFRLSGLLAYVLSQPLCHPLKDSLKKELRNAYQTSDYYPC